MKTELIEKASQKIGDNQLLINIVSKRVQQLNHGADPYVPTDPETGAGDIALMELLADKLTWREETEADRANRGSAETLPDLNNDTPEA